MEWGSYQFRKKGDTWKIYQWGKKSSRIHKLLFMLSAHVKEDWHRVFFPCEKSCVVDQKIFYFIMESSERANTLALPRALLKVRENSCRGPIFVLVCGGLCSDYMCSEGKFQCRQSSAQAEGDRKVLGGSSAQGTFPSCWFEMQDV